MKTNNPTDKQIAALKKFGIADTVISQMNFAQASQELSKLITNALWKRRFIKKQM